MNCHDCQELVNRRLDGEAIDRAVVDAHLLTCADCRSQWEAAERLLQGLPLLKKPTPPCDLTWRVLSELKRQQVARRRLMIVRVAMAAALLLAPWLGATLLWRETPRPAVVEVTQNPPLGPSMRDMQSAFASVGEHLFDVTRDQAQAVQTATAPLESAPIQLQQVNEAPAPERGVSGLDIVSNGTRRAFAFFSQEK